jgi:hypothetical protein
MTGMTEIAPYLPREAADLLLKTTAVLFAVSPPMRERRVGVAALWTIWFAVGVIFDAALGAWWFWAPPAVGLGCYIVYAYAVCDNHRYLELYWLLLVTIAVATRVDGVLALGAWPILAAAWSLAAFWKIQEREFRSGAFFVVRFLTDPRFTHLAILCGLNPEQQRQYASANRAMVAVAPDDPPASPPRPAFTVSPRVRGGARFLAWWTIALESAVALCLWLPPGDGSFWAKLGMLIFFQLTTYALVPVTTFGMIMLLLLAAQAPSSEAALVAVLAMAAVSVVAEVGPRAVTRLLLRRQRSSDLSWSLARMGVDNAA